MRAVICKGDRTSHGGRVLEGNPKVTTGGRQVAQLGHSTVCPLCKGKYPIIEGVASHTYGGKPTAVHGMKTACGATLLASQHEFLIDAGGGSAAPPPKSATAANKQVPANANTVSQTMNPQSRLATQVFPEPGYFDPKVDSFLFDPKSPFGALLRRDQHADGSTLDVYANGFNFTDKYGRSSFTTADTRSISIKGNAFEEASARLSHLNKKYDQNSFSDRLLNFFTGAMNDRNRILTQQERLERTLLADRINYAADIQAHPEKYSPLLRNLDNIRSSGLASAVYTGSWAADIDEETRRKLASLGKAAGEVGFSRVAAIRGGPAYTGARGTPDLEPSIGIPINGTNAIMPLGFERGSQFQQAARELQGALAASGISDALIGIRGSAVTGYSLTKGTRFGPHSDFDFFVESAQLTAPYKPSLNIPGFVHPKKILPDYPLLQDWSTNWTEILGREVTPGAFAPGFVPNQPSIMVK